MRSNVPRGRMLPLGLSFLTAALFFVFSLDTPAFTVGFLIHNVPTAVVLAATAVAWRWPRIGAAVFVGLGLAGSVFFSVWRHPGALVVVLPLVVVGVLNWIEARRASRQRA